MHGKGVCVLFMCVCVGVGVWSVWVFLCVVC